MGKNIYAWLIDEYTICYQNVYYKKMFKKTAATDFWKMTKKTKNTALKDIFNIPSDDNYGLMLIFRQYPRATNALSNAKIVTLQDLIFYSIQDLVQIKGVSKEAILSMMKELESRYKYKSDNISDLPIDDEEHY